MHIKAEIAEEEKCIEAPRQDDSQKDTCSAKQCQR